MAEEIKVTNAVFEVNGKEVRVFIDNDGDLVLESRGKLVLKQFSGMATFTVQS